MAPYEWRRLVNAIRDADRLHAEIGGGMITYIKTCLVPQMAKRGLKIESMYPKEGKNGKTSMAQRKQ